MIKPETTNARLRLPRDLYRRLKHVALDRGMPVSALLLEAARRFLEGPEAKCANREDRQGVV